MERPTLSDFRARLINEAEAAKYLSISRSTLRQLRMTGTRRNRIPSLPYVRLGRAIRYRMADLDEWIAKHRVSPW